MRHRPTGDPGRASETTAARGWLAKVILGVLGVIAVGGCVTPVEVKHASKAQLELLATLDSAAGDLQQSLGQFHRTQQARIREAGRIAIAKQAIDAAFPEGSERRVTADALFAGHKKDVQPWIEYAFLTNDIEAEIARLKDRLGKTPDTARQIQLQNEILTWERRKSLLVPKPSAVTTIEEVVTNDLTDDINTAATVDKLLDVLRAQIALMKQLAARVDAWLTIDVTVTQEQADGLRQGFSAAAGALGAAR